MRKIVLLLVLATFSVSCDGQKNKSESTNNEFVTNYYFIRHAEKNLSDPSDSNPDLTAEGEARAERWKDYFADKDIDAVYSTDYIRTMRTAEPTAKANGVAIQNYDPSALYDEDFKTATLGQNVVVVGHSNTTPNFANMALGEGQSFNAIDESEYFHLYHVSLLEENDNEGEVKKSNVALKID